GAAPDEIVVVTPGEPFTLQRYRLDDFAAFVRLVRSDLEARIAHLAAGAPSATYPEPVEHCDVCRWWPRCDARRRKDDHLSLVAGLTKLQAIRFARAGITTTAALAETPLPIRLERGSPAAYARVREQARVQLEARTQCAPVYEALAIEAGFGLCCLPSPSTGDAFLDIEGDPFACDGGREYLLGLVAPGADGALTYRAWWALDEAEERRALEAIIDAIVQLLERDPSMHVFHYS